MENIILPISLREFDDQFRNPLAGIMGATELLSREDHLTSNQKSYLECLQTSAQKLSSLVNKLSFSANIIADDRAGENQKPKPIKTAAKQLRILLVEDDRIVQIVHRSMLANLGCCIDIASSGCEALKLFNTKIPYDLIFMDVGLPDMSGVEVVAEIRRSETDSKKIPIIALTGYAEEVVKQQCLAVGVEEVLVKPVEQTTLEKILTQYCHLTRQ